MRGCFMAILHAWCIYPQITSAVCIVFPQHKFHNRIPQHGMTIRHCISQNNDSAMHQFDITKKSLETVPLGKRHGGGAGRITISPKSRRAGK